MIDVFRNFLQFSVDLDTLLPKNHRKIYIDFLWKNIPLFLNKYVANLQQITFSFFQLINSERFSTNSNINSYSTPPPPHPAFTITFHSKCLRRAVGRSVGPFRAINSTFEYWNWRWICQEFPINQRNIWSPWSPPPPYTNHASIRINQPTQN